MEFKRGQFSINGHHSSEFNVYMRDRPVRLSAGRVIELRERPGNDSIAIDYKHYRNTEWTINCYAKVTSLDDVSNQEDLIKAWLDMGSYSDFYYYFDKEYIYQAIVVSEPSFPGTRKNGNLIPFEFKISLRPLKETVFGRNKIILNKQETLINSKKYHSKPRIHIFGTGDISFFINEQEYKFKNIPKDIIIDSNIEESFQYHENKILMLDDRTIFDDFPIFPPGEVKIKWTGNVEKIEIIPRWVTKV